MNPPKTAPAPSAAATTGSTRKAWVKKTPVEVVLDQIKRQEDKVGEMRAELQREEKELSKLQQARKVLEAS